VLARYRAANILISGVSGVMVLPGVDFAVSRI
jgi:hypothetical protein